QGDSDRERPAGGRRLGVRRRVDVGAGAGGSSGGGGVGGSGGGGADGGANGDPVDVGWMRPRVHARRKISPAPAARNTSEPNPAQPRPLPLVSVIPGARTRKMPYSAEASAKTTVRI